MCNKYGCVWYLNLGVVGLIKQFLRDVNWAELDYLVVDTPPGTSDEHLSIVQYLKGAVDGAVIVTTPQEVALQDVRKEINFCRKVGVRVLGVVENMAGFVCPRCCCCFFVCVYCIGNICNARSWSFALSLVAHSCEQQIFAPSTGGAAALAEQMNVPLLGSVPLDPRLARRADEGAAAADDADDSPAARALRRVIANVLLHLDTPASSP